MLTTQKVVASFESSCYEHIFDVFGGPLQSVFGNCCVGGRKIVTPSTPGDPPQNTMHLSLTSEFQIHWNQSAINNTILDKEN